MIVWPKIQALILSIASEEANWANSAVKESNWQQEDDSSSQFPTWRGFPFPKPASFSCFHHKPFLTLWTFWLDCSQLSFRSSVPDLFVDTDLETLGVLWPSTTGRGTETSHSPAPQPPLYLLDMKTVAAPVWAKLLLFLLISFIPPHRLYQTRTAVSAFTLVWTQKPKTMFRGSFSFKRCLRGEDCKDTASIFFSVFFFIFFFSFLLHVERMCHAWDSEPNGRDLNWSSWSPDVFLWWIQGNFAWIHLDLNSVYNFKKGMQSLTGLGGITSDWLPFRCICQLGSLTDVLLLREKNPLMLFICSHIFSLRLQSDVHRSMFIVTVHGLFPFFHSSRTTDYL